MQKGGQPPQEKYVPPEDCFFSFRSCDKTFATLIFDSNKGYFTQKEQLRCQASGLT